MEAILMERRWSESEYRKPNIHDFDIYELLNVATVVPTSEALKDITPFEWPKEVVSGEKSVYVTEQGICVE